MPDDLKRHPFGAAEQTSERLDRVERALFGYQDEGGIYVSGLLQTIHTIRFIVVRGGAFLALVASGNFLHTWLPLVMDLLKKSHTP